jgi:hypothetical protein
MAQDQYLNSCPLSQKDLIAEYFMEYRAQLIDLAAFLDRLDRSVVQNGHEDFRLKALRDAIEILSSPDDHRVERMQMILSDPNIALLEERDQQSAFGAFDADHLRPTVETAGTKEK